MHNSKIMTRNRMRVCHGAFDIYANVVFDSAIPYSLIPPYVGNAHLFVQISWICVMSDIRSGHSSIMISWVNHRRYDRWPEPFTPVIFDLETDSIVFSPEMHNT